MGEDARRACSSPYFPAGGHGPCSWFPFSQRCWQCGHVDGKKRLGVRDWTCSECRTRHDSDINAAKNLSRIGQPRTDALASKAPGQRGAPDAFEGVGTAGRTGESPGFSQGRCQVCRAHSLGPVSRGSARVSSPPSPPTTCPRPCAASCSPQSLDSPSATEVS